ncbi:MAG TPA: CU044_2847 family protein [Nostocaceae cyanobacterium]|nr:CU044_2847 family protein [Nostocaceae cyanobacterium]
MPIVKSTSVIDGEEIDIYIEVDTLPPSEEEELFRDAGTEIIKKAGDLFGKGLALSRYCAVEVINNVNKMNQAVKPNEFEVKLAIKLDSKAGVPVIAKLGAEAQMEVTMKWTLKETTQKP